jgi:hypothetical protein
MERPQEVRHFPKQEQIKNFHKKKNNGKYFIYKVGSSRKGFMVTPISIKLQFTHTIHTISTETTHCTKAINYSL